MVSTHAMIRPRDCLTVKMCEHEIDRALEDLRKIQRTWPANILASSSVESRLGALRERKRRLEWPDPLQPQVAL